MSPVLWLLVGLVAVAIPVTVLLLVRTIGRRASASAGTDAAFTGAFMTAPALYGGGSGPGLPAIHGTGALGLTRGPHGDEVVFVLALPRREIHIPAPSLTGASIERALRLPGVYRRGRKPWLMVRWTDASGQPCVAGFVVAEPERWAEVLSGAGTAPPPG